MEKNSSNNEIVLVAGATGLLGMEICTQLREANIPVKALVRNSSSQEKINLLRNLGAEIVTGDLKDLLSLKAAFHGATAVISTATATTSRQEGDNIETVDQQGQLNVVEAALHVGVKKFVFISVYKMGYESPLETAKRTVEIVLKETGMRYTILLPTFFMEVWLSPFLGLNYPDAEATIYGEGKNKLTYISMKDVASFAIASLDHPVAANSTIELGGPDSISPLDVVRLFENQSGKPFKVQHVPVEALKSQYSGAPDPMSKSFAALMLSYAEGNIIEMKQQVKDFDITLTAIESYVSKVMAPHKTQTIPA